MRFMKRIAAVLLATIIAAACSITSYADAPVPASLMNDNTTKPVINAASGIVINADTGEVIFEKDSETAYYPASITKVMTALLVLEHCKMDEMVTFSKSAVSNLESGAVTIKLVAGDKLSVKDCLHALMLKSANEVANGLAEHVAGSVPAFAEMMNKRAKELGCTNTHFVNPNGLNDSNHYTTAHDMARITAAAFAHEELRKISSTPSYTLAPTKNYPKGLTVSLNNKILMQSYPEYYYSYAVASKTGYTSRAGSTLTTMAKRDGKTVVAVVLKSTKYMGHYTDTKALFEYGFANTSAPAATATPNNAAATATATNAAVPSPGAKTQEDVVLAGPGTKIEQ